MQHFGWDKLRPKEPTYHGANEHHNAEAVRERLDCLCNFGIIGRTITSKDTTLEQWYFGRSDLTQ